MSLAIGKMPPGLRLPSARLAWIVTALLLLLGTATAAYGFWASITSSSNAAAAADTLSPGSKPAVAANGTAVSVTWAGGTTVNGHSATGYAVTRYSADSGGTGIAATGGCAGTVTTLTCTEQNVPGGVWYYTVTPAIALWTGAESPRSTGISSDSAAPIASVSALSPAPNASGWNNTSPVTFTITADDGAGGSGVASISYTVDGGAQQTVGSASATVTVSGDGTHTVSYFATDEVGNAGTAQTKMVQIDTQAPAAPAFTYVPPYVNSSNMSGVNVKGTAEIGASVMLIASDSGGHSVTVPVTAGDGSWTVSLNLTSLSQGTITYTATATDAAGNTGPAATATSIKDTDAPGQAQSVIVPKYVNSATKADVVVTGTAEIGASVTVSANTPGSAGQAYGPSVVSKADGWSLKMDLKDLKDGTVTYTITVTDAAGNTSSGSLGSTSLKDTAAPILGLTSPQYIRTGNYDTYSISGTSDSGQTVYLTFKDAIGATVSATAVGSTWTASGINLSSLKDSDPSNVPSISITATTADEAGNNATASAVVIKDIKVPTVTGVRLFNGGSTRAQQASADSGDTITLSYSEAMDLTKICLGWTGSQLSGTATITDNGNNDTLSFTFSNCTIGTVSLGGNYLSGAAATFGSTGVASSLTWDSTNKALVIKLGNGPNGSSGAGTLLSGVPAGNPGYAPSQTLTDVAGNAIGTVSYTAPDPKSGLG